MYGLSTGPRTHTNGPVEPLLSFVQHVDDDDDIDDDHSQLATRQVLAFTWYCFTLRASSKADQRRRRRFRPRSDGVRMGPLVRPLPSICSRSHYTVLHDSLSTIPKLCLTIETTCTTSPSSPPSIQSQVLKITHSPTSLIQSPTSDLLESLDLTSFSHPSVVSQTPLDQLPLKAVYRNTVVGIRYISLSPTHTSKKGEVVFKRFQVRFKTVSERRNFVGLLEGVCPVKPAEEVGGWTGSGNGGKEDGRTGTMGSGGREGTRVPPPSTIILPSSPIQATQAFDPPHKPTSFQPVIPTIHQPLPNNFAALFPHLTSTLLPPPPLSSLSCTDLTSLPTEQFNVLLEQVLMDEGLEELLGKVEGCLKRKVGME